MIADRGLFGQAGKSRDLHPNFQILLNSRFHGAARALMNTLFQRMGDPDGNFAQEFQTHGFHSRLFELACFAYLESAGFIVDHTYDHPDFLAKKGDVSLALEVTAANPTVGQPTDIAASGMKQWTQDDLEANVYKEFPRRILSVLTKKLEKRYDLLEHCQGKPLVLAVAPYFEPGAVFHVDGALVPCLYEEPDGSLQAFAPFFSQPGAEVISAVLYSNQFTVSRFFRMANLGTLKQGQGIRHGYAYMTGPDGKNSVKEFQHDLADAQAPGEDWAQGVTLFHNPNAAIKLPFDSLPCTSEFRIWGQSLMREVHDFHPLTTFMFLSADKE